LAAKEVDARMTGSVRVFPRVIAALVLGLAACATQSGSRTTETQNEASPGIDPALALASRGGSTHPAEGTTANLGRGFDSLTGDVLGDCVAKAETLSFAGGNEAAGATSKLLVRYARTREELASALGVSVEASATFGFFSGSARAKYAQSQEFASDTTFLVISHEIVNDTQSLATYKLSEAAEDALKRGGATQFYRMCGDQFVAARVTGGSLHVVVEIRSTSQAFSNEITVGGGVQAWLYSVDGEMTTESRNALQQQKTHVEVFQAGGTDGPRDLNDLLSFAYRFRSEVTGAKAKYARPISFVTAPYSIVSASTPINVPALTQQRRKLIQLAEWHGELKTKRQDLMEVQASSGTCADKERKLENAIRGVESRMVGIEVEAQACVDDPMRNCGNGKARQLPAGTFSDVIAECSGRPKSDPLAAERREERRKREELEAKLRDERKGEVDGTPCAVWDVRSVKPKLGNTAAWIAVSASADAGGSLTASKATELHETTGWAVTDELRLPVRANLLVEGKVKYASGCGLFDGPCKRGDRVVASHRMVMPPTMQNATVETDDFSLRFECVEAATDPNRGRRGGTRGLAPPARGRVVPQTPPRPRPVPRPQP
jgi:hypothetical protein